MQTNNTTKPKLVHFGAGNIGRSLVGTIFTEGGYSVCFVDADQAVVEALRKRNAYRVYIKDTLPPGEPDTRDVTGVTAISALDSEAVASAVAEADLLSTAVGANVLPHVLKSIARGVAKRKSPVSIIFCENLHGVDELAREVLTGELGPDFPLRERVGLVSTSIGKMVPIMPAAARARDPLEVWGEAYNLIIADRQAFAGAIPDIAGLDLKENFAAYVDRKLYVHNLGHAACACEGHLQGCLRLAQAMRIPEIAAATEAAMQASALALMRRYPGEFTEKEQKEHVADLLRRFSNVALGDTVFRVGRDLKRKLAPDDRFFGALRLVAEADGDTGAICAPIAAAMVFAARDEEGAEMESDKELRDEIARTGPRRFLQDFAKLDPAVFEREIELICNRYEKLAKGLQSRS